MFSGWKARAARLKQEMLALSLAVGDRRTPWYGRVLAVLIVAYALSPLDLIPDPIPGLGYLDDLILIPFGIALLLRIIPLEVMEDARTRVTTGDTGSRRLGQIGAALVVILWIATFTVAGIILYRLL